MAPEQESVLEKTALGRHRLLSVVDGPRRAEFLCDLGVSIAAPEVQGGRPGPQDLELAEALENHFRMGAVRLRCAGD